VSPVRTAPAELTGPDASRRGAYLTEVLRLLYPPPCSTSPDDRPELGALVARFHVLPDARRPRLLVPAEVPRVAAAAVHATRSSGARFDRLKRGMAAAALRTGLSGLVMHDQIRVVRDLTGGPLDTVDTYLTSVLGRDLSVAIHIGPARPNRKPLLQLLDADGATFAFAKLGVNPLTARLVRLETAALTALSHLGPCDVLVPPILHTGHWRGYEVLVQGALPIPARPRPIAPERLAAAQLQIAYGLGTMRGSLATSGYWKRLRERTGSVPAASDDGGATGEARSLALAVDLLVAQLGDVELTFGAWHGDWTPWNMSVREYAVLLWDWDRFGTGVPIGFDALHYELHSAMRDSVEPPTAVRLLLARAPELLRPFGIVDPPAVRLTALLYLVELATRFLDDQRSGGRLGVLGAWLLPHLLDAVEGQSGAGETPRAPADTRGRS
jgi:hypothetical protein